MIAMSRKITSRTWTRVQSQAGMLASLDMRKRCVRFRAHLVNSGVKHVFERASRDTEFTVCRVVLPADQASEPLVNRPRSAVALLGDAFAVDAFGFSVLIATDRVLGEAATEHVAIVALRPVRITQISQVGSDPHRVLAVRAGGDQRVAVVVGDTDVRPASFSAEEEQRGTMPHPDGHPRFDGEFPSLAG